MKIKPVYIIAVIFIVACFVIAYDAFTSYINPYLTVSEVAGNDKYIGKEIQILATVENKSVYMGEDGSLHFNITDGYISIKVTYTGSIPPGFKEGRKIVVIGEPTSPYHIDATQILVKCPSKYES
ncbi:MAG: cytochrome c maturation protein CcmE [Candidatus Methanospirareceae archaeon]